VSFRERAALAVANRRLREAVWSGTDLLATLRRNKFEALGADGEAYRERGRAIRQRTFQSLADHLERFATQARHNGAEVHFAGDANEACSIVLGIARDRGCRLAIKMKSMLSEELELAHAFERAGVRAVETDLGEWIIQLAGEKPSHLIMPAMHKQPTEIKELFDQHLGRDARNDTASPRVLVDRSRIALRRSFIEADLGITGVNFAVAETGTLVLVSNEGNGRLVTSGPPIHVALVPIEKVVPTLDEAVTLLKLLTYSATGKITSYVNWVTGPRRAGEVDGPRELHIVLVDNGRSQALGGPLEEALHCIRCSACINVCPVYRRVGGHAYESVYSGPIGISVTPIVRGASDATDQLAHASSLCGACETVCPVKIDLPHLILKARQSAAETRRPARRERWSFAIAAAILQRPWAYRLLLRLARWVSWPFTKDGWIERAPGLSAWTRQRSMAAPAPVPFRVRFARRQNNGR
jgi:L-lactate dehydrogenase complex protein LldF